MSGLNIDWEGFKEQFRGFAKDFSTSQAKRLALKAQEEICKEYLCTVGDFYAEFEPKVWKRQYQYFNSFSPFYQNSHGWIYRGGIDINPGGMSDHYIEGSAAALNSMLVGHHGPWWGNGPDGLAVQPHMEAFVQVLASYISV